MGSKNKKDNDFKIKIGLKDSKEWSDEKLAKIKAFAKNNSEKRSPERKLKNEVLSIKYRIENTLNKLLLKESDLKLKLHDANLEENKKLSQRGFGYAQRHSKIGFSTRKTDSLKERLKKCQDEMQSIKDSIKKPLAISFNFDIKTVRKAISMITGDVLSNDEINEKFFDREPIYFDYNKMLKEKESFKFCLSLVAMMMADKFKKDKKQKPKSKSNPIKKSAFQVRLEDMAEQRNNKHARKN